MSDCDHSWIRSASKQFLWKTELEEWGTRQSFLRTIPNLNVIATIYWAGRIDEYYCSKCTEDKVVKRVDEYDWRSQINGKRPEWWSQVVGRVYLDDFFFWPDEFENPGAIDYSKHLPKEQLPEDDSDE